MIVRSSLKIAPSARLGTFAELRPAHLVNFFTAENAPFLALAIFQFLEMKVIVSRIEYYKFKIFTIVFIIFIKALD